jgi:hypothetical protein
LADVVSLEDTGLREWIEIDLNSSQLAGYKKLRDLESKLRARVSRIDTYHAKAVESEWYKRVNVLQMMFKERCKRLSCVNAVPVMRLVRKLMVDALSTSFINQLAHQTRMIRWYVVITASVLLKDWNALDVR